MIQIQPGALSSAWEMVLLLDNFTQRLRGDIVLVEGRLYKVFEKQKVSHLTHLKFYRQKSSLYHTKLSQKGYVLIL